MNTVKDGTSSRAASLIFTLYGDFGAACGGTLWVGTLITLMAEFAVAEQTVRQALSRMVAQGWLKRVREGGRACYALTQRGNQRIAQIAPRIYESATEWDGRWRVVIYNIPEGDRGRRDRLRKDLTLLGLAPLSTSVWVSPRGVRAEILTLARDQSPAGSMQLFAGEYEGPLSDRALLERCWDLDAIAGAYRDFIVSYDERLKRERRRANLTDREAFVERLQLVQRFRTFLYRDPGLPSALLPPHWPGSIASALFRQYYALLTPKALRFFKRAL